MYGICDLSIVSCRKEPTDKSEMVTQLLFGEHFSILELQEKWIRIKIAFDNYECWIDKKQCVFIEQHTFDILNITKNQYLVLVQEKLMAMLPIFMKMEE